MTAVGALSAQEGGVQFENTLRGAAKKARETGKMVFVDVYTTWCGHCTRMTANVFPAEKTGAYLREHFVSVKIDADQEEWIKGAYGVRSYPTFLLLADDGRTLLAHDSSVQATPDAFIRRMEALRTEAAPTLAEYRKKQAEKAAKKDRK